LIVMIGPIFGYSVEYFEELLYDASPGENLHLMLVSQGGDGEVAVRLVRAAQARCARMTVIVPDYAKSAATLLALGAHEILMGPTSDLGPVDPQFQLGDFDLVSAKDMIAAVERALDDVADRPDTYPLHASLLADVGALKVEQARSALARTDDLVREALSSNPERSSDEVDELVRRLHEPLIEAPKEHAAIFSAGYAKTLGLPRDHLRPRVGSVEANLAAVDALLRAGTRPGLRERGRLSGPSSERRLGCSADVRSAGPPVGAHAAVDGCFTRPGPTVELPDVLGLTG
jgi:hypothetical protein